MNKKRTAPKKTAKKTDTRKKRKMAGVALTVEKAAYFKAENDGFRGDPVQYWLAAEAEVNATHTRGS